MWDVEVKTCGIFILHWNSLLVFPFLIP